MLDCALCHHASSELDLLRQSLGLGGGHADDLAGFLHIRELNPVDVVEALSEMGLHCMRISGLRQNLQQFVIG